MLLPGSSVSQSKTEDIGSLRVVTGTSTFGPAGGLRQMERRLLFDCARLLYLTTFYSRTTLRWGFVTNPRLFDGEKRPCSAARAGTRRLEYRKEGREFEVEAVFGWSKRGRLVNGMSECFETRE